MDENKIVNVKALLYDADTDEVKRIISQTEDQEILYVYAYNYNWDHGFDIQVIGMCSRDKGCAKSRGERQALHDTSGKNGIHGLNYDIRDGIKKSALL